MFFIRFNGFLRPTTLQIFIQKLAHKPACPPTLTTIGKHQYDKPNCKTAIIIGGTGSIGIATATQLLCSKGGKVALIDTDICKGKDAVTSINCSFGKDKAIFLKADATNKLEIQDSLRQARGEFKHIDMIVNAFGIWNEKKWEDQIKVNLVGTLNVNQIAPEILVKPGGLVINIVGLPGLEVFSPSPVLAASFSGVLAYTTSIGHERNSHLGVRFVALCCGITETNFAVDVDRKVCCPKMGNDLKRYLKETCWQKPEVVGKAVIEIIKFSPSGTIWIVEGSRLFSMKLPDLVKTYQHLENQFI